MTACENSKSITTLSSKIVYHNDYMTVREDEIQRLDGSQGLYSYIEKPDFALVIPEEDNGFWLVEQYRYPIAKRSWEFPQGAFPQGRAGTADELAAEELREETGIVASTLNKIGYLHCAKGFTGQGFHIFHALDLTQGTPQREVEEQDMRHQWFPKQHVEEMLASGQITDDSTLAAYALLMLRSGR